MTTSVSPPERLCSSIAHQFFDPGSSTDRVTYSDACDDLLPVVVEASPLDSSENDTSCRLLPSAGAASRGGDNLIPDDMTIEQDTQAACTS